MILFKFLKNNFIIFFVFINLVGCNASNVLQNNYVYFSDINRKTDKNTLELPPDLIQLQRNK